MSGAGPLWPRNHATQPPAQAPDYRSTLARSPRARPLSLAGAVSEQTGPVFDSGVVGPLDHDLIRNYAGEGGAAIGERILVFGRVLDENGRPVSHALVEIWQANAGGRYRHVNDDYLAALDPNFGGCGRAMTDSDGAYAFRTIRPGPYPWPNGPNSWRPAHIHFSVFGDAFAQRLITQMYFEGDPLIWRCPIVRAIPDDDAIRRLIAPLDMDAAAPFDYLAYRFDIVLRGRRSIPFESRPEGN